MGEFITIQKEKVPAIGLGTYQLTGKEGEQIISTAIAAGYRHIDTAHFYHNEETVGSAVKNSGTEREKLFITTKVWPTDFTKKNFVPSVEQSLRKLKSDYIDLLLLHWPSDDDANERAVDFLLECLHKQYTRLVGVSNFSIAQLEKARQKAPVFCNQVEYNPYNSQQEMLQYVQQNDMMLTAYTPLARGKVANDAAIISLAEKYHKTPGQIVLRWLTQQKNVCPIPKGGSEKHLLENMQLFDFELSNKDMDVLFNLNSTN